MGDFLTLGFDLRIFLAVALAIACGFEFANGFHDTANAVATVIYTRSLRPWAAVIWSGLCNFSGVFLGGIAVAIGIVNLLPVELLVSTSRSAGLAMVLALLVAAILWNLGTWYFGIPASSSHTLIGAIMGVGLANSLLPGHVFGSGVNWEKAGEIGLSLLISPLIGFFLSAGLVLAARWLLPNSRIHEAASNEPPPLLTRATLIATCTGVSFAHGSNDGQKGVGLIMLILVGILPARYALNPSFGAEPTGEAVRSAAVMQEMVRRGVGSASVTVAAFDARAIQEPDDLPVLTDLAAIRGALEGRGGVKEIPRDERWQLRSRILLADNRIGALIKAGDLKLAPAELDDLNRHRSRLRALTDYAPFWVLAIVALSLGLGTMIGWKRIVVTVGEKIGKQHLTYTQGAAAELVAMTTIGISAAAGVPVSTTHVLSSGVAGTMVAERAGVQVATVRSIALAWVLTLPVSMILAGLLFLGFRALMS